MEVNYIYERFPHHSKHSGYDQLVRYLGKQLPVFNYQKHFLRPFLWRIVRPFINKAAMVNYGYSAFFAEISAATRILLQKYRIFHFLYGENSYRYLGLLRSVKGNRIVSTYHQPPYMFNQKVKNPEHIRKLDAVIVVGSNQIPIFEKIAGSKKVFWIPHGIDIDFFQPTEKSPLKDRCTCLSVGFWFRDFQMLRQSIKIISQNANWIQFIVVTNKSYFKYFNDLSNINLKEGISEEELLKLYQESDVLLLPLKECTANNSLLEGMACGLPVVTTDVGSIRDYVDDTCAILVPPGDIQRMVEELLFLLQNNSLREKMGRNSRKKALQFAWPNIAQQMRRIYQKIL